jgi:anaerobic magnesium-protoporphyrin IX monomethyl ester cyclase
MARVLLILPHLPQRMGAPYLGQQYIAASLLAAGHEVKCLDAAAVRFEGDDADVVAEAERFSPDMIGMTLFTLNARRGYLLAKALRHTTRMLVAGGPHPTVLPREALDHGFDVSVAGEGEHVVRALATYLDDGGDLSQVPGVFLPDGHGPPNGFIDDLDALAFPLTSYSTFDPALYSEGATIVPGGMMTSRGCPARCSFCANYVTGRGYRFRSTKNIIAEMVALNATHDVRNFPFWDDAFTARRPRLNALCDGILAEPRLRGITWTCITPGNMVRPVDLERMRAAGCVAINFGIESGDYNVLKIIQKGQRPEQVRAAVRAAKAVGMTTIVNFMFGFPGEGVPELDNTLRFMEQLAEDTDFFNNRGVLVPFPGTTIYDQHRETYGLEGWWLDPAMIPDAPNIHVLDPQQSQRYLEQDPTLDLDFFRYTPAIREKIAECVRFKALHNQRTIARMMTAAA